jgi:hypothetical protein
MKRFLLFAGQTFYPSGGLDDFVEASDDLDTLKQRADRERWDWAHILDQERNVILGYRQAADGGWGEEPLDA